MEDKHKLVSRIFGQKYIKKMDGIISCLGNVKYNTVSFTVNRIFVCVLVFILVLLVFDTGYLYAPIVMVCTYYLYYYVFITKKLKEREKKLDREALQFFEILTLTLESGRNLQQSLKVTCENVDSELSGEFKKSLEETNYGKSLIEALEDMKKRIPSETINNIILNIIQTNQFGNSILDTLYNQVDYLREKQILGAKEQINKIPNKVSIVSVIFIVPLIIVLILGPYLIEFIS